jgi:hypothetical protein
MKMATIIKTRYMLSRYVGVSYVAQEASEMTVSTSVYSISALRQNG